MFELTANGLEVSISEFALYMEHKKTYIAFKGEIKSKGLISVFRFNTTKRKYQLMFGRSDIFNGLNPKEAAIQVKTALRQYLMYSEYVPNPLRQELIDALYNHSSDHGYYLVDKVVELRVKGMEDDTPLSIAGTHSRYSC